jgi:integrase
MSEYARVYQPGVTPPEPAPVTVNDVVTRYLAFAERRTGEEAHAECTRVLGLFADKFGHQTIDECRPLQLQDWLYERPSWKSDWTLKRICSTIQHAFKWAAKMRLIPFNPFDGVTHPVGEAGRPMTDQEFSLMLRASSPLFRKVLIFLRYTGCRPGEMSAARWEFIDLERCTLTLRKHKTSKKTKKARTIVLHGIVIKLLAHIRREQQKNWADGFDFVFMNSKGVPWKRSSLSNRLKRLRKKTGLPKDCRLYGLRTKFATDAILGDMNIKKLSVLMGHASVKTTEGYCRAVAEKTDHLRAELDKIFSHRQ